MDKLIYASMSKDFKRVYNLERQNMTKPEAVTPHPCPLCECPAIQWVSGAPGCHYLRCEGCGLSTDDGSKERILARWNNRPAIQAAEQRGMERERERWERLHADNVACYEKACAEREHFRSLVIRQGEQA